jgi:hypothetical protein
MLLSFMDMTATAILFNESLFEIIPLVREPLVSKRTKVKGCINILNAASNPCERVVRFTLATGASDTLNFPPHKFVDVWKFIVVNKFGFE